MSPLKTWLAVSSIFLCYLSSPTTAAYFSASSGHPAAQPLPSYCQMGDCFVQTIEAIDPISFGVSSVLFRVENQNWHSKQENMRNSKREADTTSYVLCSKNSPAVIYQHAERKFIVSFLAPNDGSTYGHVNETSLAMYFIVCHGRAFNADLFDQGPVFAESLGYSTQSRDDQPTITAPEKIFEFLK